MCGRDSAAHPSAGANFGNVIGFLVARLPTREVVRRNPNEYRAILRHLLHQGGQIDYTHHTIASHFDRPDKPRVSRALTLLTEELNATPARLSGDRRLLT